jgi:hypothetical protein
MTDEGTILHIKPFTPKALRVQRGGGADTISGRAEYSYTAQLLTTGNTASTNVHTEVTLVRIRKQTSGSVRCGELRY